MQNDERDKLIDLIVSADISLFGTDKPFAEVYADHLIANDIIVPPCKIGETLYLIQVDYRGNYSLNSCEVGSKITMFSILRAYEEKTILFMSTDKKKAEKKIKELEEKSRNGK